MKFQLYRKFATIYRPFLVKLDQDLCALFSDPNSPIGKALGVAEHQRSGNLYDPCPIMVRITDKKDFKTSHAADNFFI